MPPYEITLIARPLAKTELVNVLHRAASVFFNKGAVIKNVQSLGNRDLPFRQSLKQTKEHVYTTNSLLVNCHMSIKSMIEAKNIIMNDLDILRIGVVNCHEKDPLPRECNLEDLLKTPAYRKSVADLRANQKMARFVRLRIFKRTEQEWKKVPKSYTTAPPRH